MWRRSISIARLSETAKALVFATGRAAQLGAIADTLHKRPPITAFALGVRNFGRLILRLTVLLVLFTLLVNLLLYRPLLQSLLFALALAVGLTPELLPMIISVTLAYGAMRLSRKRVIVKRLTAIHDLGSMDVLCSDKTGTLTEARIALAGSFDLDGKESPDVFKAVQLNAAFETGLKSPLDDAVLAAGAATDLAGWRKIDEAPFDFERRRVSVLVEGKGRRTYANILKYVMMGTSSNFGNMFSMAAGALLLPFLPMLPIQILLNNLLYDFSEIAIPLDNVENEMLAKPRRWDMAVVREFMFVIGPISSAFDFVVFYILLRLFHANAALFHSSWFVESLATQILVIFIIRGASPLHNAPHPALAASSLAAAGLALWLPYTSAGQWFGFVPIPSTLLGALMGITILYLSAVYIARNWFFRRHGLS